MENTMPMPISRNCVTPEFTADHGDLANSLALWRSRKTNQIHKQATGLWTDRARERDRQLLPCSINKTIYGSDSDTDTRADSPFPPRQSSSFCCCALIANLAHALATATNKSPPLFMYLFIYILFINENYPRHRITNNFRFADPKVELNNRPRRTYSLVQLARREAPFIIESASIAIQLLCIFSYYNFVFLVKSETFARCTQIATINNRRETTLTKLTICQRVPIPIPIRDSDLVAKRACAKCSLTLCVNRNCTNYST